MTKLSRSLLLDAKAKVRPFRKVSIASVAFEALLTPCRTTKLKVNSSSSSLLKHGMKEGNGEDGEDSGS